jgi:hypothetical protein
MYSRALKEAAQDLARGRATVALKSGGMGRLAVRYKASAPGLQPVEVPAPLAAALATARAALGDERIVALLGEASKTGAVKPTAAGTAEQVVMKAQQQAAFDWTAMPTGDHH